MSDAPLSHKITFKGLFIGASLPFLAKSGSIKFLPKCQVPVSSVVPIDASGAMIGHGSAGANKAINAISTAVSAKGVCFHEKW